MVARSYQVVWTQRSQQQLKQIYEYISKDSLLNASRIVEDIVLAMNKAASNPEFYNLDKYKESNDGSYRAFEKHRYRISYRVTHYIIRVLRVRHTSREPQRY